MTAQNNNNNTSVEVIAEKNIDDEIKKMKENQAQGIGCHFCQYGLSGLYCNGCKDYYADW